VSYQVAPIFLIRMAGAPFDAIEALGTEELGAISRKLVSKQREREEAKMAAEKFFSSRQRLLQPDAYRALRVAVREGRQPDEVSGSQPPIFDNYARAARAVCLLESELEAALEKEVGRARAILIESSQKFLPGYLLFGTEQVRGLLADQLESYWHNGEVRSPRNHPARKIEQSLLLYLQRIATKNDTFSQFGPSGWGVPNRKITGLSLNPEPGIAKRDAFMERWTAHAAATAINADSDNSNLRLSVPALEPYAMRVLRDDVEKWPAGPLREKWLPILQAFVDLPVAFAATTDIRKRQSIMSEARSRLQSIGAELKASDRFLYAATNPIAEECFRECHFEISESLIGQVAAEAEPWIDLWRDNYSFIASRVSAGLRNVMEKGGAKNGVMPLPTFLQACEAAKLPLTWSGLVALAVMAFQEVKAVFRKRLQQYADLAEYELTPDDCHVVRDNFDYPKFDEYSFPSADLQLSASSIEAIAHGDCQWILAELHPPAALLHHGFYWDCPDQAVLNGALNRIACDKPNFYFGFFAADFTAHTTVRLFDAMPELSNFVAPLRANPKWKKVLPANAEVYVDEESGDVCLRRCDNHEHLGSFARTWIIPLGFHPFNFSLGPRTPRFRCGEVIVQRRAWIVTAAELAPGKYQGISSRLVLAIEKLRGDKDLPRYVYIRPTEQALRRSGAEGRDKDTKPIFIDLESYLSLEIFHRWLTKAGEIEVTEMLPDPQHLFWKESDGRHSFELRTLIVPQS
jgi:hypothetical protein